MEKSERMEKRGGKIILKNEQKNKKIKKTLRGGSSRDEHMVRD